MEESAAAENDNGLANLPKKKKHKDKDKDKKKAKKDKEMEEAEQAKVAKTFAEAAKATPLVRQGKFVKGGKMTAETERKTMREKLENYDHVHKGWMLELGVELIAEDKHSEFTLALRQCFDKMKLICDKVVIDLAKAGKGTRWRNPVTSHSITHIFLRMSRLIGVIKPPTNVNLGGRIMRMWNWRTQWCTLSCHSPRTRTRRKSLRGLGQNGVGTMERRCFLRR